LDSLKKIVDVAKKARRRDIAATLFGAFMMLLSAAAWAYFLVPTDLGTSDLQEPVAIQYNEFLELVDSGHIVSALISQDKVDAVGDDGKKYVLHHDRWLYSAAFPKDLVEAGVEVSFPDPSDSSLGEKLARAVQLLVQLLLVAFLGIISLVVLRNMRGGGNSQAWPPVTRDKSVKFADVAGQEESKFELQEIKEFLQNPAAFEVTGAKPPRGVLMVGPPGTGKTLLAKALAGEAGVNFIPVTGSDFSAMFVGVGRNRVERLFKKARKNAPCIVFIDEIDSVARKRGIGSTDVGREQDTTLNQLLTEMNGFTSRDGVVVIGATNRLDVLDPALTRPGRFDRHVHVGNADMGGRKAILEVHTRKKPLAADVDLHVVARGTPGFSGADLENLVNEAAILAARQRRKEITAAHFEEARDKVLMGLQRESMVLDESERKLIAVHEAGHAVAACLTPGSDPVHQATIIPRGRSLGLVMRLPERDRISVPKSRLLADLDVAMAGRAAESLVFGDDHVTTGAESDIEQATRIARKMVSEWGMSERIGMMRAVGPDGKVPDHVEAEVRDLIHQSFARVRKLLVENRACLDRLTEALLDKKTLDGSEVRRIVEEATEQV